MFALACTTASIAGTPGVAAKAKQKTRFLPKSLTVEELYRDYPLCAASVCVRGVPTSKIGKPLQYGVFAIAPIPKGTRVIWYGGERRARKATDATHKSHLRVEANSGMGAMIYDGNAAADRLRRPVPMSIAEREEMCRLPYDDVDNLLKPTSAVGFMVNSNWTRVGTNTNNQWVEINQAIIKVPVLIATRDIAIGDELRCYYGNEKTSVHAHNTTGIEHSDSEDDDDDDNNGSGSGM